MKLMAALIDSISDKHVIPTLNSVIIDEKEK